MNYEITCTTLPRPGSQGQLNSQEYVYRHCCCKYDYTIKHPALSLPTQEGGDHLRQACRCRARFSCGKLVSPSWPPSLSFSSSFGPPAPKTLPSASKYLPTNFSAHDLDHAFQNTTCPSKICPQHTLRSPRSDDSTIDDRYRFEKHLSSGFEGNVAIYHDLLTKEQVVIKSFKTDQSPLRNTLPLSLQRAFSVPEGTWPTEIAFMLLLSGLPRDNDSTAEANLSSAHPDVVPILDYFLLADKPSRWQLVTPLYTRGTLANLPKSVRSELGLPDSTTATELDQMFRGTFNRLVASLATIHQAGFCHDDIKPANIFVSNDGPQTWILGDFGQVRERDHPYQSVQVLGSRSASTLTAC